MNITITDENGNVVLEEKKYDPPINVKNNKDGSTTVTLFKVKKHDIPHKVWIQKEEEQ